MEDTLLEEIYERAWEDGNLPICLRIWNLRRKYGLFPSSFSLEDPTEIDKLTQQVTKMLAHLEEGIPMQLRDKINDALKEAMKQQDTQKVSTLRLIKAALKDKDIACRSEGKGESISEEAIFSLLQSLIKQREQSIALFQEGDRPDLAEKENNEINVIRAFLPQALSDTELTVAIEDTIKTANAQGPQGMGAVMALLKQKYPGQLDMTKVSARVKSRLIEKI